MRDGRCHVRSIAIFVAALSLSCGLEVVVFSPARRASRKLLERIVEYCVARLDLRVSPHPRPLLIPLCTHFANTDSSACSTVAIEFQNTINNSVV